MKYMIRFSYAESKEWQLLYCDDWDAAEITAIVLAQDGMMTQIWDETTHDKIYDSGGPL